MKNVGTSDSGARSNQTAVDINIRSASVLGTANRAGLSAPSNGAPLNSK
jgi:hypothetical protein